MFKRKYKRKKLNNNDFSLDTKVLVLLYYFGIFYNRENEKSAPSNSENNKNIVAGDQTHDH